MSLPSQRMRTGHAPRFTVSKRNPMKHRRARRRAIGAVLLAMLAFTVWYFWPGGGPRNAQAKTPETALLDQVVNDPAGESQTVEMIAASDTPKVEIMIADEPKALPGVKIAPPPPTLTMGESPDRRDVPTTRADTTPVRTELAPTVDEPTEAQPTASFTADAGDLFRRADLAISQNRPVQARELLNRALHDPSTSASRQAEARRRLTELNELLFFSDKVVPGDDISRVYKVQKGDLLSTIPRKQGLELEYGFLARLNGITDPRKLRLGQQIKVVQGPFHAVVYKSAFRLDLYCSERDAAGNRLYLRSYDVGLGEYGSTPVGLWVVADSKVVDPGWTNPRTYKTYAPSDPENPIGDRWIGLKGADERTKDLPSYGIHGTIEPESIGREASMGCVRMREADVEVVYELLMPGVSEVLITE
ncbi:MAG: L,D-transpeptidase family protein [Phycisphaerales bacterium]|nr:L,D-transpeptidase family protein [Phycisphaerales bacterium]